MSGAEQTAGEALARLEAVIADRLAVPGKPDSYVAALAAKGLGKVAQKLGEEATETVIAALTGSEAELTGEAADLVFHLTLLLHLRGLSWGAVAAELTRREGVSGLAEKAGRKPD